MKNINTDTREIISLAALETLEARQLMSAVSFENGVLIIKGSALRQNHLAVEMSTDGTTLWGTANTTGGQVINTSSVKQIRIIGGEKRDVVRVDNRIRVPVYVQTGNGNDDVATGRGNDTVVTGNGRDIIRSRGGADLINAGNDNDWVDSGTGNDRVDGDDGTDTLLGGVGKDTLSGNSGDDKVTGGSENDRLVAGIGLDSLRGGYGNDTLMGDSDDTLAGDDGDDKIERATTSDGGGGGGVGQGTTVEVAPVYNFALIDADTNLPINGYENMTGTVSLNLADLPTRRLAIRANTPRGFAGSVSWAFDGVSTFAVDNAAPFSLHGDTSGDFQSWTPSTGTHTLTATTHELDNGQGRTGNSLSLTINVTDRQSEPDPEPTVNAPRPVINALEATINAGHAFHVNAMGTDVNNGSMTDAKFKWDFGDPDGRYNKLNGWNASHVYDEPGSYTITLRVTNAAGATASRTFNLTVQAANRRVLYVSTGGSDNNTGLSPQSALRTIEKARTMLSDNTEILLKRGETFSMSTTFRIGKKNVVIGSYGMGTLPKINWTGTTGYGILFATESTSRDVTVQDILFDQNSKKHIFSVGGTNFTVRGCEFRKVDYVINNNRKPTGVTAMDNSVPLVDGMDGYFAWVQGTDQVYLGNTVANSVSQHCIRIGGASRINVAYNDLSNVSSNRSGVSYDISKGTITVHTVDYAYIAGNELTGGDLGFGPLGQADGFTDTNWQTARSRYGVIEDNHSHGALIHIDHGSEHVMVRNNVVERNDSQGFRVEGFNTSYNRGVVDLTIMNNTVLNNGTTGRFLWVQGAVDGIKLKDNLYVAPRLVTGAGGSAAVYVSQSSLSSFTEIDGNIWNVPAQVLNYADGGYMFVGSTYSTSGHLTPTEWNAMSQVGDDYYRNITLGTSYQGTYAGHTAGSSLARAA